MASVLPSVFSSPDRWKESVKRAFRDLPSLFEHLEISQTGLEGPLPTGHEFPLFVPREFADKMSKGDLFDPLLRQILPVAEEFTPSDTSERDVLQENSFQLKPGLLQKYKGRALLITTGACAVHCRYCFRRHYPYDLAPNSMEAWQPAITELRESPEITEVLLSGGDPLMLVDDLLFDLIHALESIEHIERVRIHTRLPIMIPCRVSNSFVEQLTQYRFSIIMVVHSNHPAELGPDVTQAFDRLSTNGIPLLNQTVLLKGINDDAGVLTELSRMLVNHRVFPYYLHQLDRVQGVGHFAVARQRGVQLVDDLRTRLPGYAVPRFVQEIPGEMSKTILR